MLEQFIDKRFNKSSLVIVDAANEILSEFAGKGFTMTLRQLHYQFVSHKVPLVFDAKGEPTEFYENTQLMYKRLGNIISEARLAGLVDWAMMEDRLRSLEGTTQWDSPAQITEAIADQYRGNHWDGQKWHPEVWIEKDALAGVVESVCNEFYVRFFACRGYVSQSAQYEASKRFIRARQAGREPIVFHLGDHDPSGLDMSRENKAKFKLLTGEPVKLVRLALNHDQVLRYNPPPNPAKMGDTRAPDYVAEFGNQSWELDALSPEVIEQLIRDAVDPLIDRKAWAKAERKQETERGELRRISDNWEDVREFIRDL